MNTFDVERAIAEWKRALRRNPALEDGQAAELEACLRDEVEELREQGTDPEAAFRRAVAAMGPAADAGVEFYKAKRIRRSARPLSGGSSSSSSSPFRRSFSLAQASSHGRSTTCGR